MLLCPSTNHLFFPFFRGSGGVSSSKHYARSGFFPGFHLRSPFSPRLFLFFGSRCRFDAQVFRRGPAGNRLPLSLGEHFRKTDGQTDDGRWRQRFPQGTWTGCPGIFQDFRFELSCVISPVVLVLSFIHHALYLLSLLSLLLPTLLLLSPSRSQIRRPPKRKPSRLIRFP